MTNDQTPSGNPPPDLEFTPVERQTKRWNGINALRQRAFIRHLVACGSVTMAAKAINTSQSAMYQLRKASGAESFAAAWERAVDQGARRVLDLLVEHAIHGTPETLSKDGQVILERRRYNHRSMMWIVQNRFPETYGGLAGLLGTGGKMGPEGTAAALKKLKERWRKEWEEETEANRAEEERSTDLTEARASFDRVCEKYQNKVREEMAQRREGNWIGADYALRQLTHIEMIMEVGGATQEMIEQLMVTAQTDGGSPLFSSPISRHLAARRQRGWDAEAAENPRPPLLDYPNGLPSPHFRGGLDIKEREALRKEATAMFAQALHKWEVSVGR